MGGSILIITEGAKTEKRFVESHFKALGKADSYSIFSYCCNLYDLYQRLSGASVGDDFENVDIVTALKQAPCLPSKKDLRVLDNHFTDIFLVFDMDIHDKNHTREEKLEILAKMAKKYTDSTDNGLLLLNSPMAESYRDYRLDDSGAIVITPPISVEQSGEYKELVDQRGAKKDIGRYPAPLFSDLAKANHHLLESILGSVFLIESLPLVEIVRATIDSITSKQLVPIYNEMVLLPYHIFGNTISK